MDIQYPLCNSIFSECIEYLFTIYVFSEAIWRGLSLANNFYAAANLSFRKWCLLWLKECVNTNYFAYIIWYICKYRCIVFFNNVRPNPNDLTKFIKKDIPRYLSVHEML